MTLNNYTTMIYRYIIIIILIFGTLSCKEKLHKTTLFFSSKESVINNKKNILDSIVISRTESKILIRQYRGSGNYLEISLIRFNNGFSELRKKFNGLVDTETDKIKTNLIPVDTLPTFYKIDTFFTYKSERNFYHSIMDLSLGNARYKIKKNKDTFMFIKKSTIDSSYEEEYYYDKNFNIIKYIVKYRGNIYIYK